MIMRRDFLRHFAIPAFVCGILGGNLLHPVVAHAAPVRARPAHDFVNSMGVATHFAWAPSPYRRQYAQTKAALGELGIRHIREQVGNASAAATFRDLFNSYGVKLCAVVDGRRGTGPNARLDHSQIQPLLDRAKNLIGVRALKGIEGPNEYNILERAYGYRNWPAELRAYQAELNRRVKADPALRHLPVIAPSLADPMRPGYAAALGNLSASIDRGNAHVYPNWLPWDQKMKDVMPFARMLARTEAMWVTETGWHSAINSGTHWVSEDVQVKYLPRAMASFVAAPSVERAYIYQLVDPKHDPGRRTTTAQFGLIDYGFRRKPTFYAVRNMMHIMCDNPLNVAPQTLSYSLSGNMADVRTQLFQKRNGSFYLMMWAEKQSWRQGRALINPPQAVRIRFEQAISQVRAYRPSDQSGGIANSNLPKQTYARPGAIDLTVGDAVTVLEIVPAGRPVPPVATRCDFTAI
jgi:hypothetical protein